MDNSHLVLESEMTLTEFISNLTGHSPVNMDNPQNGSKIWDFIKTQIANKHPHNQLSSVGITDYQRNQWLELCATMYEIIDMCEEKGVADVREHMSLLQEAAIALGSSIEKVLPDKGFVIKALEDICEKAYVISQDSSVSINQGYESLKIDVSNVKKEINNFSKKLNIVFLPYKYSMWDSLESVWEAASADEETLARVIPIPYVERSSKGGAGESHYELDRFMGHVPVEIITEIDLEKERPDAIFIHNPYDDANYVTSVYPDYYASKIRKYTDELIYIPYCIFNPEGMGPQNVEVSGVLHANHVILQSRNIRDLFAKYYADFLKKNKLGYLLPGIKEKFVDIGSPKIDRLAKEINKEHSVPMEWKQKIGCGEYKKQVIFIDTHLTMGMKHNTELSIKKIDSMLKVIDNHKDIVFIWRPHPLFIETIKATNPDFYPKFAEYVDRISRMDNMIYDDNEDTYMALSISDGYYGNGDSLRYMYSYTGRPELVALLGKETS